MAAHYREREGGQKGGGERDDGSRLNTETCRQEKNLLHKIETDGLQLSTESHPMNIFQLYSAHKDTPTRTQG